MALRVVRLGSKRSQDEGLRIGTVRRPPRGVPKSEFASQDWYDVWFPTLAPSVETLELGQAAETPKQWAVFAKHYRREMNVPQSRHAIALLAALSHTADFSVGCYCEDESHCHRSILKALLVESGATLAVPCHTIVWRYRIRAEARAAFERDYGPDGAWARLFRRHPGYLGTDLRRVESEALTYTTFDRWTTAEARAEFMRDHGDAYAALDAACGEYTVEETFIGEFAQDASPTAD